MNLLSIENLAKSYGERVLFADVTLGIDEGDKIGLIGVNGTGKSTFLKVLAGLEPAVVLAYYSPEGAFQWSVSFKNSHLFKDIWTVSEKIEDKLTGALKYRDGNDYTN